jgi:hypothetical protein
MFQNGDTVAGVALCGGSINDLFYSCHRDFSIKFIGKLLPCTKRMLQHSRRQSLQS